MKTAVDQATFNFQAKVRFPKYASAAHRKKAISAIRRYILETLNNEAKFIPLFIDLNRQGHYLSDRTLAIAYRAKSQARAVRKPRKKRSKA